MHRTLFLILDAQCRHERFSFCCWLFDPNFRHRCQEPFLENLNFQVDWWVCKHHWYLFALVFLWLLAWISWLTSLWFYFHLDLLRVSFTFVRALFRDPWWPTDDNFNHRILQTNCQEFLNRFDFFRVAFAWFGWLNSWLPEWSLCCTYWIEGGSECVYFWYCASMRYVLWFCF